MGDWKSGYIDKFAFTGMLEDYGMYFEDAVEFVVGRMSDIVMQYYPEHNYNVLKNVNIENNTVAGCLDIRGEDTFAFTAVVQAACPGKCIDRAESVLRKNALLEIPQGDKGQGLVGELSQYFGENSWGILATGNSGFIMQPTLYLGREYSIKIL